MIQYLLDLSEVVNVIRRDAPLLKPEKGSIDIVK